MAQLSKRKIKPTVEMKVFELLFEVLGKQSNSHQFNFIINGILSPSEKIMIAKRIAIIFLLIKQVSWVTIEDILKVSNSSISKCQMILVNNEEVVKIIEILVKQKNMNTFFEDIFFNFFGPGTAYINWKNAWKRKKQRELQQSEIL